MTLAFLQIENLRNIQSARLSLHPHLNLIIGPNGSGKTSLLEAIYLLSTGHSFRTREINPLISHNAERLTVFARKRDEHTVSIQKSKTVQTLVRLNNSPCHRSSDLARFLPCQVFYQDMFQFIEAGPAVRRSLLDWGLFHVKPVYHDLWKTYRRALKQRNTLLRQNPSSTLLKPWNLILDEVGFQLHLLREDYFVKLQTKFHEILRELTEVNCSLHYFKGWDKKGSQKNLASILEESYHSDCLRQFTQHGPHQADLVIRVDEQKAKHYLSRGQQKMILFALKLAQVCLLDAPSVLLCDDLSSELDEYHLQNLLAVIQKTKGQFLLTGMDTNLLKYTNISSSTFHILEGSINL